MFVSVQPFDLTVLRGGRIPHTTWRFVSSLRATLNIPLKGQVESPLSLDPRLGVF